MQQHGDPLLMYTQVSSAPNSLSTPSFYMSVTTASSLRHWLCSLCQLYDRLPESVFVFCYGCMACFK